MLKKILLLLLIVPFLFFTSCSDNNNPGGNNPGGENPGGENPGGGGGNGNGEDAAKYELSGLTASEFFTQKGLTIGWNVGNALDAEGSEASWTQFMINQDLLDGVKAAGFNVLRIPITWHHNTQRPIGPAPDYKLNKNRLERVVEVVDMAYDAGFKAVIINIHHDGAPNHTVNYWLKMDGNAEVTAEVTAQFSKVWEQIAERFKDYGDWLIFEGMNEPRPSSGTGNWGWNPSDAQFTLINEWNQVFTDAVRGTGGNNTERFLVIQPISARAHLVMDNKFLLPTDTTPNKQIVSVHWYYPEAFSLNGTSFAWGTDADKSVITQGSSSPNTGNVGFTHYKTKYTSQGIPMIIGECGATYQANRGNDLSAFEANRIAYLSYLCEQAKANGLVPIIWDNGRITATQNNENFGLFDRYDGAPLEECVDAITAMMDAVKD